MVLPNKVKIVEVGPRDGLQNEAADVPTAIKVELIDRLAAAGVGAIEAGSFVSPKWVPRMADTGAVLVGIQRHSHIDYPVLVPNMKGFELARQHGVTEVAVFAAATEAFSQRNTNCSINESLSRFEPIFDAAKSARVKVRGYVSVVLGCPYQGAVPPRDVARVASELYQMGSYEVSLGDTIGTGTPASTKAMWDEVMRFIPPERLGGHFHDTYGQALANIYASLEMGVAAYDSSIAGLGGCPYAKGATGNVATEDVVYMLDGWGIDTGIDLAKLIEVGAFICDAIQRPNASRAGRALLAKRR